MQDVEQTNVSSVNGGATGSIIYNVRLHVVPQNLCTRPDQPVGVDMAVTSTWSLTAFPPTNTANGVK